MKFKFISAGKKANISGALLLKRNNKLFVEEKFDGSRFGLERTAEGWQALSRYGIDRMINIPYIEESLLKLDPPIGTVLDCEVIVMHEDRKLRWELSRSVMGTKEFNPTAVKASLLIFDIQHYGDIDYTYKSYLTRRKALRDLLKELPIEETQPTYISYEGGFCIPRTYPITELDTLWDIIVEKGAGEGVMIKDVSISKYGKDWMKVKKEHTIDCFVIGTTPGKGKYEGQIGALEVAVMNGDVIWPIGKISSLGDNINRFEATKLALEHKLKNKVIEVKFNEVTKGLKLRHGRFLRWREDKNKEDCKVEQLKDL